MSKDVNTQLSADDLSANASNQVAKAGGSADSPVSVGRRRLARLGLGAAPIVMTLASRPVFAGQCLSNMMSGNLSNPNRGNCAKGWSPGGWGQPGGNVHIYTTVGAWAQVGLLYGNLNVNGNANKYSDYTGGATLAIVPPALNKDAIASNTLLREVLTNPQLGQLTRHFVCAYLNAQLSAVTGSTFTYILTTQQVLGMASGGIGIPAGAPGYPGNFNTFFDSTWQ